MKFESNSTCICIWDKDLKIHPLCIDVSNKVLIYMYNRTPNYTLLFLYYRRKVLKPKQVPVRITENRYKFSSMYMNIIAIHADSELKPPKTLYCSY